MRTSGVTAQLLRGAAVQVGADAEPQVLRGPEVQPAAVARVHVVVEQPPHRWLGEQEVIGTVRHCRARAHRIISAAQAVVSKPAQDIDRITT